MQLTPCSRNLTRHFWISALPITTGGGSASRLGRWTEHAAVLDRCTIRASLTRVLACCWWGPSAELQWLGTPRDDCCPRSPFTAGTGDQRVALDEEQVGTAAHASRRAAVGELGLPARVSGAVAGDGHNGDTNREQQPSPQRESGLAWAGDGQHVAVIVVAWLWGGPTVRGDGVVDGGSLASRPRAGRRGRRLGGRACTANGATGR